MADIKDAPFVGIAEPTSAEDVDKLYWMSASTVADIAEKLGFKSVRAVSNAVKPAVLRGIFCVDCETEASCKDRGAAAFAISSFASKQSVGRPFLCRPCEETERMKRLQGRSNRPSPSSYYEGRNAERAAKSTQLTAKDEFYKSWEWRTLRMEAIKEHGRSCQCCGAQPGQKDGSGAAVRICVDHIKPISKFWHLRLDRSNLQILCDECNQGKGNWGETDFRPDALDDDSEVSPLIIAQLTDMTTARLQ